MVIIVCLDEKGGMLFGGRRLSRDKAVTERIRQICKGKRLWMNSYSYKLYGELEGVEIIIFWWNRKYPADMRFDLELEKWERMSSSEFPGMSHERITEETYRRKGALL